MTNVCAIVELRTDGGNAARPGCMQTWLEVTKVRGVRSQASAKGRTARAELARRLLVHPRSSRDCKYSDGYEIAKKPDQRPRHCVRKIQLSCPFGGGKNPTGKNGQTDTGQWEQDIRSNVVDEVEEGESRKERNCGKWVPVRPLVERENGSEPQ